MEQIKELLMELIRFKTLSSEPRELERCAEFIEDILKKNDIPYQRYEKNGIPSLSVLPENQSARVLLLSHMDVVDGPESMFNPIEKNGCLYGRGSIDDKYAIALSLFLYLNWVKRFRENEWNLNEIPFGLLITGDEETGGDQGAGYVLPSIRAEFCIALDGGNPDKIVIKEKGPCKIKLTARGKSAHGARPWLGENAIDILIRDINSLQKLFSDKQADHWHKTLNVGVIQSGKAHNQVPDLAEAWLDVRYTEQDDIDQIIRNMDEMTDSLLSVEMKDPVFFCDTSEYLERFLNIHPHAQVGMAHGASDAKFLMNQGIPGFIWGANGNKTQHSEQEHVELKSLETVYEVLDRFFKSLCG